MKKSDLITHLSIATLTFVAMIPSMIHHGVSLNLSIYLWGAIAQVGIALTYYSFFGAKT